MMETKAKKGDLVRVTSTEGLDGRFKLGEVVMISDCLLEAYGEEAMYAVAGVYLDGEWDYCLSDSNFEVVDNPQEYEAFVQATKNGESPQQNDAVNHPNHYTQGRFETIEVIEEIAGGYDNGYVAYCVGNAIKYLSRAPHKHATPVEDLRKAATYLDFAIKAENRRAT